MHGRGGCSYPDNDRYGNAKYGDISVDYISPQGATKRIGVAKGMAVYTPNPSRRVQLALDQTTGVDYRKGKLRIAYITQADTKAVKMAETELVLQ